MTRPLIAVTAVFCFFVFQQIIFAADESLAALTIVVYNRNVPESVELAKFYAQKRGITRDHLVSLACSKEEEISREEYDETIANPLRAVFKERRWWTLREGAAGHPEVASGSIRFVAVIKGMPLKIRSVADYPGDKPAPAPNDIGGRNEASVDSEIAILAAFTRQISGPLTNGYFQSYRPITEVDSSALLLVCRLDAPSSTTVRRMIVDAIEAEKNGLWGRAYIDGAHNLDPGLAAGDEWLAQISTQLRKAGIPVVYDTAPAIFPDGYPMSDCALYYGWYAAGVAGPFTQFDFRFVPGAIAAHIHSFSASTLRDANAFWVGPLLNKGAAASLGNVYEPYLQLTAHLDIFNDRLLHGFTFAESAYMSIRALSWMSVMVGDPLYRPYLSWLQIDSKRETPKSAAPWKMYRDFTLKNAEQPAPEFRRLARQLASRACNGAMLEDLGAMESQEGNFESATSYFQQARTCYSKGGDLLRVVLEEVETWIKQDKRKRALALVRNVLGIISDPSATGLLKKIEQDLEPLPPSPQLTPKVPQPNE